MPSLCFSSISFSVQVSAHIYKTQYIRTVTRLSMLVTDLHHSFIHSKCFGFNPAGVNCISVSPGEYSYLGTSLRQADIEPMPSLSDVRQLIALYGVLPLGE